MLPPLSEVTTRPDEPNFHHGKMLPTTLIQKSDAKNYARSFSIRSKAGESSKLEKCKSSETFISCPARGPTPVLLKNKRQQPRRNPNTEPNVTI
jgi:hypothetical protein